LNFEELYEEYAKDIFRFSFWLCGNSDEAKDITSETFVKVWKNFGKIRTETMKGLLLTIARNIYIDNSRKQKRWTGLDGLRKSPVSGADKDVENKNQLESIYNFLDKFPEIDRTAFLLRVENELPYEEIANILQLSVPNAKVKVHRVRKDIIKKFTSKEK